MSLTAADFLQAVWPATGVYVLATPFQIPESRDWTYVHKTFTSIADAAAFATHNPHDLYFGVHSLREAKVWNPNKKNRRDGTMGAYEVRTQANSSHAKAFFLDLDVGVSNIRLQKYESQQDALQDLIRVCKEAGLPKPMVVSSGGGIHVYWVLQQEMPTAEWRPIAQLLKRIVEHHQLKFDPARVTDSASVLRVAGTLNCKREPYRPVDVLRAMMPIENAQFLQCIQDAAIRAGLDASTPAPAAPVFDSGLGNNLDVDLYDGPPTTFRALVTACAQMQRQVLLRGNVSEPEWYHTINLVRFVENGSKYVHKISEGHPTYSREETDAKVAQLEAKGIKPTSCAKLAEVAGQDACFGCVFAGKVKSPIVAARYRDPAPPVVALQTVGSVVVETEIPPPPAPYMRLKSGGVVAEVKNKEGETTQQMIYPHDIYPIRRLVNAAIATEQHVWCVVLPREGPHEFLIDSDALYDRRKFVVTIANHGVYPSASNLPYLQDYMIAYINELQRLTDAETQCNHLGWIDEQTRFVMPDKILLEDGTAKPAMLGLGAARATAQVHKRGDLLRQVELLRFYNHPAYIPNQFFITAGLAAPIFFATGHHGAIINASGEAGSSKSTSLYTAASLWGQPELYPINGTNNGATVRGRNERVTTLANLPVCVDEITNMSAKDATDLAMSITQPGHRIRLEQTGIERVSTGSYKATLMLSTANNSLHSLLSVDNAAGTAGSMRVFEILFLQQRVHQKHEADAYWHELKQHYGHVGEVFMAHVVAHREQIEQRVRDVIKEIDMEVAIASSERFWSAAIGAVLVAGEIANQLGLLSFDVAAMRQWALYQQIPHMRGVVVNEYASPIGILADYLETINSNILIASKPRDNINISNIQRAPTGQLLAHYDIEDKVLWVLKKGFKDYCIRTGSNMLKILDELHQPTTDANGRPVRIVSSKNVRKVLGAGTNFAKAQTWCFSVNMAHPEVTGGVELSITSGGAPTLSIHRASA